MPGYSFNGMIFGSFTRASLTSAYPPGQYPGKTAYITDGKNGAAFVTSNETEWVEATGKLTFNTVVTQSSATPYVWTFPSAFLVPPCVQVSVQDNTAGIVLNHKITARSTTSVTVQVDRSSTLISVLGVSVLSVAAAANVTIHITAQEI